MKQVSVVLVITLGFEDAPFQSFQVFLCFGATGSLRFALERVEKEMLLVMLIDGFFGLFIAFEAILVHYDELS